MKPTYGSGSALPLGGYVKISGMIDESMDTEHLNKESLAKRFIIVFAGPFFNFILAIFFYFLIFVGGYSGFKPEVTLPQLIIVLILVWKKII